MVNNYKLNQIMMRISILILTIFFTQPNCGLCSERLLATNGKLYCRCLR